MARMLRPIVDRLETEKPLLFFVAVRWEHVPDAEE